jgi:hypothetical protein
MQGTANAFLWPPLVLGTLVFLGIVIGYRCLGFSVLRGDPREYFLWSSDLWHHRGFGTHMPGFPALLALARLLTMDLMDGQTLLQTVAFVSWLGGLLLADRILDRLAPEARGFGLLWYALAPLVGVATASFPYADGPAYAFFLAALLAALHARWWLMAGITSLGLLNHQSFYPFYFCLALVCVTTRGMRWFHMAASGVPFLAYYIVIALQRRNPNWIVAEHAKLTLKSRSHVPLFDGILSPILRFDLKDSVKVLVLLSIIAATAWMLTYFVKRRNWTIVSLLLPLLVYALLANDSASTILIRLSKILVFPGCLWLTQHRPLLSALESPMACFSAALLLMATQVAWAGYEVFYFSIRH